MYDLYVSFINLASDLVSGEQFIIITKQWRPNLQFVIQLWRSFETVNHIQHSGLGGGGQNTRAFFLAYPQSNFMKDLPMVNKFYFIDQEAYCIINFFVMKDNDYKMYELQYLTSIKLPKIVTFYNHKKVWGGNYGEGPT